MSEPAHQHWRGVCKHGRLQSVCNCPGSKVDVVEVLAQCDTYCVNKEANAAWAAGERARKERRAEEAKKAEEAAREVARKKAEKAEAARIAALPRCETCRFASRVVALQDGERRQCLRHAPVVSTLVQGPNRSFPWVADDDWCGDWKRGPR